ncbi:hypothetical protein HPP92_026427 [Vanilla planifolia]|uniref:Phytosulfokine n=1 Tax=Vanilla planifolia TaxID=51239 RepID=A0A835PFA5_VANPL|nr:hypothetical protein HPP92_026657 [Vanilla planifolia]KAG0451081.1 hypothetical protein HPP92_026427 [Vanilla planifolia]KAG0473848.1 hypothetical protein HPP92_015705 [Vanilla planifolia]
MEGPGGCTYPNSGIDSLESQIEPSLREYALFTWRTWDPRLVHSSAYNWQRKRWTKDTAKPPLQKAMGKAAAVFVLIVLFLSACRTQTARPSPAEKPGSVEVVDGESVDVSCAGVGEEEEDCLMRRTLAAHTDYIYTQEKPHV